MSRDDPAGDKAGSGQSVVPYEVGYSRPPAEHRFKKGTSGNPKGRPKGSKKPAAAIPPALGDSLAVDLVLLGEAYRPVSLREGDQPVTMPMVSAVYRALAHAGLKGNRLAGKTFVGQVEKAESRRRAQAIEVIDIASKYKNDWSQAIDRARTLGIPEPEVYPHPDDIMIGPDGAPLFVGPRTAAEQAEWLSLEAEAKKADEEIREALAGWKSKRKRDAGYKRFYFDEMVHAHRIRLMMRTAAPDEATRRAHRYHQPHSDELRAIFAANKAKYRLHDELTEAERRIFVWEMERYERGLAKTPG